MHENSSFICVKACKSCKSSPSTRCITVLSRRAAPKIYSLWICSIWLTDIQSIFDCYMCYSYGMMNATASSLAARHSPHRASPPASRVIPVKAHASALSYWWRLSIFYKAMQMLLSVHYTNRGERLRTQPAALAVNSKLYVRRHLQLSLECTLTTADA